MFELVVCLRGSFMWKKYILFSHKNENIDMVRIKENQKHLKLRCWMKISGKEWFLIAFLFKNVVNSLHGAIFNHVLKS